MSVPFGEEILLNSSFSPALPTLQLAWDSTSLGLLKTCPYKYYLSIICGWTPVRRSVHLTFGIHYHAAIERYDHGKASGLSHDESVRKAVRYALEVTWNKELSRPWISDDPNKNRRTLIRTIIWYLIQFEDDPITTVILSNGKPAVELSFRMQTSWHASTDEPFFVCGHLDRLGIFQDDTYVVDKKTTKHALDEKFFAQFSPDNQMSTYGVASKIVYEVPVKGIIIDGAQVGVNFSRFQRGQIVKTEGQLEEWYSQLPFWLGLADSYARAQVWPMNDKSCFNCDFRGICARDPKVREQWLKASFTKRVWDPLQVRGDI